MRRPLPAAAAAALLALAAGCGREYAAPGSPFSPDEVAKAAARPGTETWRARVTGL